MIAWVDFFLVRLYMDKAVSLMIEVSAEKNVVVA